jgi:hypothetical protein
MNHNPAASPSGAPSPLGNIAGEVTIQDLLADPQLVPGMRGAYLRVDPVHGLSYDDISRIAISRGGAEIMVSRETTSAPDGLVISDRYRVYSGTPDQVLPPAFLRQGPNGELIVEQVIGHTHPFPVPFRAGWNQPSAADILYLRTVRRDWQRVFGQQSQPFGRIFGLPGDAPILYGPGSTPGNAVYP